MTHNEWMRGLSARIQNLRERIVAAEDDHLMDTEEAELLRLEWKREALVSGRRICEKF
jgi:hypothetical protein